MLNGNTLTILDFIPKEPIWERKYPWARILQNFFNVANNNTSKKLHQENAPNAKINLT